METLIFIAIAVIISIIQKKAEQAKKNSSPPPSWQRRTSPQQDIDEDDERDDENMDEDVPSEPASPVARKLQEYIKQFEQAQQEAAQGTLEPAMPPPVPETKHRRGNNVTLREVVEVIVDFDVVNPDILMEEFGMSRNTAIVMLEELEHFRIIGRDMGVGEHDVLIQDISELDNLLSHPPQEAPSKPTPSKPTPSVSPAISEKQNQMKILEERARKAREEAAAAAHQSDVENGYTDNTDEAVEDEPVPNKSIYVRSISRESVRRGFIWSRIIDEPRFKRRWSPAHR